MDDNIDNYNSLWGAIKESIIHIIKSETSSTGGKINLIFGIIASLFLFVCFVPTIFIMILNVVFPGVEIGIPVYVLIILFIAVLIYFILCVKYVDEINELKSKLK